MGTPNIRPSAYANQRRSQRILLSMPILVSGERLNGAPFSERTKTQIVNAHGALVQLREHVHLGQQLRVKNMSTNEEQACTVMDVNAGNSGISEVGVEFVEPCPRFWRVSFPPADWTPRSAEAKHYGTEHGAKVPSLVKK